jgi:hypothetical protein
VPLSSTGESGNCELDKNNVYFFITSGGHRIRCGVTDLALGVLEPKNTRRRSSLPKAVTQQSLGAKRNSLTSMTKVYFSRMLVLVTLLLSSAKFLE